MTAMTAATIDNLSDGRMLLGIGSSGPQVAEGWHGQRFGKQIQRTREYVDGRAQGAARASGSSTRARRSTLPLPDGPGKALKLTITPVQDEIPIFLAAIGPNNTKLAGEVADGWIPMLFSPEHVAEFRPLLEEGAAARRAARSTASGSRRRSTSSSPTTRRPRATSIRPFIALYVGGMGSREKNFYNALVQRYGFEEEAKEVQDLYLEGKKDEARRALSRRAHRHASRSSGRRRRSATSCRSSARRASTRSASRRWRSTRRAGSSSCGCWPS